MAAAVFMGLRDREDKPVVLPEFVKTELRKPDVSAQASSEESHSVFKTSWGSGDAQQVVATRDRYQSTDKLQDFFEAGLRSPESGGLYYAKQAYAECTLVRTEAHKREGKPVPNAIDLEIKRCQQLGGPASYERISGVVKTSVAALDPLDSTLRALQSAVEKNLLTVSTARGAIDTAVSYGDPYLLLGVQQRMAIVANAFDGQPVDDRLRQQLKAAALIASCDLGMACDSPAMTMSTCDANECAESAISIALPNEMGVEERTRITRLADRITSAARAGNLSQLWS